MSWTFTLWIALLLVVFMGFFAGIAYLAGFTLLGTEVEDEIRGRTFAIVQSLVRAALILSLAIVPFGVGLIGRHQVDLGVATVPITGERVMLFVAGLLALGVGVRRLPADGRRPAGPAAGRRRHRAPPRHHRPPPAGRRGVFIAFEGGEGAGKSTQVRRLQEWLTNEGLVARATFEPGATPSGAGIRSIVLDRAHTGISSRSEALLYAADRAQHVHDVLRPGPRRRRGGHHRPVRRQLAGLPGRRPHHPDGRRPDDLPLGDRGPAARPHRAAGPAARGRPGAGPRPGRRRPARVGVAGVPPAGAADVPRARRGRSRPLLGRRRRADPRRDRSGDPRPGGRAALGPAAAAARRADRTRAGRRAATARTIRTPRRARPPSCTRDGGGGRGRLGAGGRPGRRRRTSCARRSPIPRR